MNNDLISREVLKTEFLRKVGDDFADIIDNAPTVPLPDFKEGYKQAIIDGKTNFSRPQGTWVVDEDDDILKPMKCSNCDEVAECLDGGSQFLSKFCPNCGAYMKGKKNENKD